MNRTRDVIAYSFRSLVVCYLCGYEEFYETEDDAVAVCDKHVCKEVSNEQTETGLRQQNNGLPLY